MIVASSLVIPRFIRGFAKRVPAFLFVVLALGSALGQSTEQGTPTPIRAADINAAIAVRDLGDPRLTRHFYIFTATPGDLTIAVESRNLNGDVDIFTAGSFRPLVKINLYASEGASRTTKSIYLRARQDLILRVEGRSPNDDEGHYRIRFDGAFEPFSGEIQIAETETPAAENPTESSPGKKGRRVSAVGARIDEPAAQVEAKAETGQPAVEPATPEKTEPAVPAPEPARTARGRTPSRRTPRPSRPRPAPKTAARTEKKEEAKTDEAAKPAAGETDAAAASIKPEPQVELGPRLLIETKDGEKIERSMSTVRRVVVDNGQIIVILRTGKVERTPLANVARMSIEP